MRRNPAYGEGRAAFDVYTPNKWQHLCVAFGAPNSIKMALVRTEKIDS